MIAHAKERCQYDDLLERDAEMFAAAKGLLASSKYGPLRKLTCRVFGGVVELSGKVPSFYLKQLAQAAMLQLAPAAVRNLIEVNGETIVLVATSCDQA